MPAEETKGASSCVDFSPAVPDGCVPSFAASTISRISHNLPHLRQCAPKARYKELANCLDAMQEHTIVATPFLMIFIPRYSLISSNVSGMWLTFPFCLKTPLFFFGLPLLIHPLLPVGKFVLNVEFCHRSSSFWRPATDSPFSLLWLVRACVESRRVALPFHQAAGMSPQQSLTLFPCSLVLLWHFLLHSTRIFCIAYQGHVFATPQLWLRLSSSPQSILPTYPTSVVPVATACRSSILPEARRHLMSTVSLADLHRDHGEGNAA